MPPQKLQAAAPLWRCAAASHRERLRLFIFDDIRPRRRQYPQVCARRQCCRINTPIILTSLSTVNSLRHGTVCLSSARQGGIGIFATLGSDHKLAALTAESMGKELSIVPYTGFMRNRRLHAGLAAGIS